MFIIPNNLVKVFTSIKEPNLPNEVNEGHQYITINNARQKNGRRELNEIRKPSINFN